MDPLQRIKSRLNGHNTALICIIIMLVCLAFFIIADRHDALDRMEVIGKRLEAIEQKGMK